jgi:hypothetical protein
MKLLSRTSRRLAVGIAVASVGILVSAAALAASAASGAPALEITNTGRHSCALRGVSRVAAVRNGHLVGAPVPGAKGPLVTLRPGATAHLPLNVGDAGAACPSQHPVTAGVVVYLPGQATAQSASMTVKVCRNKPGGGVLGFTGPIRAGVGIPLYTVG